MPGGRDQACTFARPEDHVLVMQHAIEIKVQKQAISATRWRH